MSIYPKVKYNWKYRGYIAGMILLMAAIFYVLFKVIGNFGWGFWLAQFAAILLVVFLDKKIMSKFEYIFIKEKIEIEPY